MEELRPPEHLLEKLDAKQELENRLHRVADATLELLGLENSVLIRSIFDQAISETAHDWTEPDDTYYNPLEDITSGDQFLGKEHFLAFVTDGDGEPHSKTTTKTALKAFRTCNKMANLWGLFVQNREDTDLPSYTGQITETEHLGGYCVKAVQAESLVEVGSKLAAVHGLYDEFEDYPPIIPKHEKYIIDIALHIKKQINDAQFGIEES